MAGLGFKDFQVGEVLTAADVDGYLMQQAVMRFADSAARGSALGTATGTGVPLAEGMVSYLDDADSLEVFDGTVWRPSGRVLQIVSTAKTDTFTTTSTSFTDVTGLTATITPTSASNKVLIIAQIAWGDNGAEPQYYRVNGGNASSYVGNAAGSRTRVVFGGYNSATAELSSASIVFLDAPATTAATTYAVQARVTANTAYVNRTSSDNDSATRGRGASSITLIEVVA